MTEGDLETIHVVGAAILYQGSCLAVQRGDTMSAPLKWEFPGGKIEDGESPPEALRREVFEELDLEIEVREPLGRGTVVQKGRRIVLDVYRGEILKGTLRLREHRAFRWLTTETLDGLDWAEADVPVLPRVRALLGQLGDV